MSSAKSSTVRLSSLDQYRGYAVAAMIVVNFLGGYACTPRILRHTNDYCSYADTIMPNFLFAVGFAIAIVWHRASTRDSASQLQVWLRFARRCGLLMLVAFFVYFPLDTKELGTRIREFDFWFAVWKRDWFQTLTHIACTTLWLLPVLPASWRVRWSWLAISIMLHVLLSHLFYFHWVHASPGGIDGGPLGFLTWAASAMLGLWAGDSYLKLSTLLSSSGAGAVRLLKSLAKPWIVVAMLFMLVGYGLSCLTRRFDRTMAEGMSVEKLAASPVLGQEHESETSSQKRWREFLAEPPFVPPPPYQERAWNYWMMSQKAGTVSYQLFAAGLSLALFLLFVAVIDVYGLQVGVFRTLGRNAIACYVLHGYVMDMVRPWISRDASPFWVCAGLLTVIAIVYGVARLLEWRKIFIRL